ncbi:chitobiase/beta-hexosaminidase C-terminal domain-containing protein [uncultured Sphaerochaeta sp.]|uniref:chitobiase/beta-hexosaminidase C-terminal domain-containing protein n=1 Tax=uncultured Sphaerochaeta sp. TaxID=886478 RepID=UPI002A0A284E|nr:chitobiase/beta-hexosaminidase C-terminal domain-containing protein [uncultured Sphaerochaeta sp.]
MRNRFWLFTILGTVCLSLNISCSDILNFKLPNSVLAANISWPTAVFDGTLTKTIEVATITGTLSQDGTSLATVVNDSVDGASSALLSGKVSQLKNSGDLRITLTDTQGEETTYRCGEVLLANNDKNPIDISLKGYSYITSMPSSASFSQGDTIDISIGAYPSTAKVYFTTDGEVPTTASTLYTGPITIDETTTVKAVAVCDGYVDSAISTGIIKENSGVSVEIPPLDTTPSIVTNDYKTFAAVLTGVTRTAAIGYTWYLFHSGDETRIITTEVGYITFDNLEPSESYRLVVKATNGSQNFNKSQTLVIPETSGAGK